MMGLAAALCLLQGCADPSAEQLLTLATTTSTDNSGLLAKIHPDFKQQTGIRIKVIAKGTGAALQLARDGNADVVLVHARAHEDKFVADGFGVMRRDVMHNDFVIVGPAADPARVKDATTAADALRRIADGSHLLISRGDGSGTHIKEQAVWQQTGLTLKTETRRIIAKGKQKEVTSVRPPGTWYLSIGQGMGETLVMATEKRAYTLVDRGTYYAFALATPAKTDLVILSQRDEALHNPYGVIAVNPKTHAHANFDAAKKYIEWITSPKVQKMIGEYRIGGKILFHPN
ncbi:MAG: substrate-binding domain-containing protein [Candidatus Nealsonbacteria bacterium]|nr:substrate-binding domain-containing protein [Candidatus Nealsonbacteria bacterium]